VRIGGACKNETATCLHISSNVIRCPILELRLKFKIGAITKAKGTQRVCPLRRIRDVTAIFRKLATCDDACCGGYARCDECGVDDANDRMSGVQLLERWIAIQFPWRVTAVRLRSGPELKRELLLRKDGSRACSQDEFPCRRNSITWERAVTGKSVMG
jgi:hypothetical protein